MPNECVCLFVCLSGFVCLFFVCLFVFVLKKNAGILFYCVFGPLSFCLFFFFFASFPIFFPCKFSNFFFLRTQKKKKQKVGLSVSGNATKGSPYTYAPGYASLCYRPCIIPVKAIWSHCITVAFGKPHSC